MKAEENKNTYLARRGHRASNRESNIDYSSIDSSPNDFIASHVIKVNATGFVSYFAPEYTMSAFLERKGVDVGGK